MSTFDRYAAVHDRSKLAGPGDARPTALQIVEDNGLIRKWSDRTVLITGCSSGIGIATAKALHATGARIYATARNLDKGKEALASILSPNDSEGRCTLIELKLDSLASVRSCAARFLSHEPKLNILINNAGIMGNPTLDRTEDGFEAQFGTNHVGHFLLFQLLKPALLAASTSTFHSRVISVSSLAHRNGPPNFNDLNLEKPDAYTPFGAYGSSKTANIWFANELERRYGSDTEHAIHANSLHPGGIATGLQIHMDIPKDVPPSDESRKGNKSQEQGAATTVWAAVDEVWEGKGGKFLEDVQVSQPADMASKIRVGYAPWAFDVEGEKRLWEVSCEMVGLAGGK